MPNYGNGGYGGQQGQPSNYTNFNRYFNANKDASQRQADQIAGQTQVKADAADSSIKNAQNTFNTNVGLASQKNAPPTAEQLAGSGQFNPNVGVGVVDTKQTPGTASIYEQALHPTQTMAQYVDSRGGADFADQMANTRYAGPQGFTTTQAVTDQANAAQGNLDALGNQGGVQALIQQGNGANYGNSNFSAGLVGAAGRNKFDALRSQFNPEKQLSDAVNSGKTKVDAAKATIAANDKTWADAAAQARAAGAQPVGTKTSLLDDAANAINTNNKKVGTSLNGAGVHQKTYDEMSDEEKDQWLKDQYTKNTQNSPALQNMFGSSLNG